MTYSRPGTSTVNALFLPAKPAAMPGVDRRVINVGDNGRFLDFSNPAQAGKNAGQGLAEISNFLSKAVEAGAPIYKAYLQDQGNKQAGEFLKNVDVAQLYRSADNDQRNLLKDLNPFAQDLVNDAAARSSARTYTEVLAAERVKNTTLSNPYASEAERAKAEADVRTKALDASGIKNIPAGALAPYVGSISEAEGSLKGDSYKAQLQTKSNDYDLQIEKGLGTTLKTIDEQRIGVLSATDEATRNQSAEQYITYRDGALKGIQSHHDQLVSGGVYTSKQYAERWAAAFSTRFNELMAAEDLPGAMRLIGTVQGLSQFGEIKTPGGVSLWDIKLGDGEKSIRTMADGLGATLKPKFEEWQREQLIKQFGPDMVAAAQGDDGARGRVEAMLPLLANDPQALSQVVGQLGQMQSFARTPTEAQLQQQMLLEDRLNDPNRDRAAFSQQIRAANLTTEQKISLMNRNNQPQDPTLTLVGQGMEHIKPELTQTAMDIARARKAGGDTRDIEDIAREQYQNLSINATKATEKRIKDLIAAGETVTPMRAAEIARNEGEALRNSRLKDAKRDPTEGLSWDQKVMGEVNYVQEQLRQTGGVGTIRVFPQSVLDGARAAGVPLDYRNVQRYFLNRISTVRDPQGKPAFPDPQKMYRQMVDQAKPKPTSSTGRYGQQMSNVAESNPLVQGLGALKDMGEGAARWLIQQLPQTQSKPQPQSPAKPQETSAKPKESPAQQVLMAGLNTLMNVVAPPAAASEMPRGAAATRAATQPGEEMLYANNIQAMARLWSGQAPMDGRTPALPQVSAAAAAEPVGLAINNVMHPFLVAIGIAEGTRTPSGGYTRAYYGHTDPGNGARNVGTVSAQNAGNPVAADRMWMARLSQQAVRVAPVLGQLGVRPGTVAYNRLMFNVLDLSVQAPAAISDFIRMLPRVLRAGATIEAIAKARADSFINPATGRLDAGGFGNSYSRLLADQRSRAGAFDYKRRL